MSFWDDKIVSLWEAKERREDEDSERVIAAIKVLHQQAAYIWKILDSCDEKTRSNDQFEVLLQQAREIADAISLKVAQIEVKRGIENE